MSTPRTNDLMEKIVSLCKRRGFILQSSEIYGGINGFWDYGPLGAELKRRVRELWWRSMTQMRDDVVGLEATIIMHPMIWKASGHVDTFVDLMRECPLTKKRVRADQVEPQSGIAYYFSGAESNLLEQQKSVACEKEFVVLLRNGEHQAKAEKLARQFYELEGVVCPVLHLDHKETLEASIDFHPETGVHLGPPRPFNLMFKTYVGSVADEENVAFLRPETAQAIFAQFKSVLETSRQKVPFGIAQIGKAFRNEINPRNFTFRSREFEQMELEFFIRPDEVVEAICGRVAKASEMANGKSQIGNSDWGWEAWHKYWVEERIGWYESIGLPRTTLVEYWQRAEELAHYARATVDILFKFPFSKRDERGGLTGEELEGIAARGDFDLSQHQRFSGRPMGVFDEELRAAWARLDEAKKKDLWRRYHDARYQYLTRSGVPGEQAVKEAKESADDLAKGNYIPHVIEPSAGVDRLILALICHAYSEDQAPDEKGKLETRVVMRFHPRVAPIKVAVFPLLKNRPELVQNAREVRDR